MDSSRALAGSAPNFFFFVKPVRFLAQIRDGSVVANAVYYKLDGSVVANAVYYKLKLTSIQRNGSVVANSDYCLLASTKWVCGS